MHQRSPCVFRSSLSPVEKWGHTWPRLGSSHLELGDSLFPLVNPEIILHALAICLHRCEWEPLYSQHIVSDALVESDSGSPYTPADSSACNKVTEPWSAPSLYTGTATTQTARSPRATAICIISCLRFLPHQNPLNSLIVSVQSQESGQSICRGGAYLIQDFSTRQQISEHGGLEVQWVFSR